jgi:hypothetical protein
MLEFESQILQPPAHAGSSLANFSTLKTKAISSSETSVHTRSTRRHIPDDGIYHSYRRKNLKFDIPINKFNENSFSGPRVISWV